MNLLICSTCLGTQCVSTAVAASSMSEERDRKCEAGPSFINGSSTGKAGKGGSPPTSRVWPSQAEKSQGPLEGLNGI